MSSPRKKPRYNTKGTSQIEEDSHAAFLVLLRTLVAYENPTILGNKEPFGILSTVAKNLKLQRTNTNETEHKALDLGFANRSISFFALNLSLEQYYECYKSFYKEFDQDDSLRLEKHEFFPLLDYFAKPENLGKQKIKEAFKSLDPKQFELYTSVAINNDSAQLESDLKEFIFASVMMSVGLENCSGKQYEFVNYLKFLPMMMSFFAHHIQKKVMVRMINLEIICGLDASLEELPRNMSSLHTKLKSLGIRIKKGSVPPQVSFKDIEKTLILFKSTYASTFTNEQLNLILSELKIKIQKKALEVHQDTKKTIQLNYKLLRWISYRLCLHCALFTLVKNYREANPDEEGVPPYVLLQEYTLWAAAYQMNNFNQKSLEDRFNKYAEGYMKIALTADPLSETNQNSMKRYLKEFLIKIFPHLNTVSVENMLENFKTNFFTVDSEKTYLKQLAASMEQLLIKEATSRMHEIFTAIHHAVRNDEGMKKMLGKNAKTQETQDMLLNYSHNTSLRKEKSENNKAATKGSGEKLDSSISRAEAKMKQAKQQHENEHNVSYQVEHRQTNQEPIQNSEVKQEQLHSNADQNGVPRLPLALEIKESQRRGLNTQRSNLAAHDENDIVDLNLPNTNRGRTSELRLLQSNKPEDLNLSWLHPMDHEEELNEAARMGRSRFQYNLHTKQKPDILTSLFIVESFLEKYIDEKPSLKTKKSLKGNQNLEVNVDGYEEAPIAEQDGFTITTMKESLTPSPNNNGNKGQVTKISRSNLKLAESYAKQISDHDQYADREFYFNLEGNIEQDIDEIQFSPLEEPKLELFTWSGNDKKRREGPVCGYTRCQIF